MLVADFAVGVADLLDDVFATAAPLLDNMLVCPT
jgi:hypothetical protein